MGSGMVHNFGVTKNPPLQRSILRTPSVHKTTIDAGYLYPIFWEDCTPGDVFRIKTVHFLRTCSPLYRPIIDNMYLDIHWFFIPYQQLWENFTRFHGERPDPDDHIDYSIPIIETTQGFSSGSLYDYLGIPTGVANVEISALPPRAYAHIWNNWYRDTNSMDRIAMYTDDGPDEPSDYALMRRCKRADPFTTCLPWPQRGDAVTLPVGTSAPVYGNNQALGLTSNPAEPIPSSDLFGLYYNNGSTAALHADVNAYDQLIPQQVTESTHPAERYVLQVVPSGYESGLYADLSSAVAATINQLREAEAVQQLLERDAVGGTRYPELLRKHWATVSADHRFHIPEFLGASSDRIQINTVAGTSGGSVADIGTLGGHCTGAGKTFIDHTCREHGLLMAIASVRADITYQQGLDKYWSKRSRYEFLYPELCNIGEQPVYARELFCTGVEVADSVVFGYEPQYNGYRYHKSIITGQLNSAHATTLDIYHLSQEFSGAPQLNYGFLTEDPPLNRVLTITSPTMNHFMVDFYFDEEVTRCIPMYGVPGLSSHL